MSMSTLPETLAQRVRFLREQLYMTPEVLAWKSRLPLGTIEDIESGVEMFLAPSVRSRLARALQVRPGQIKEVEKVPDEKISIEVPVLQRKSVDLLEDMRANPDAEYTCPRCSAPLVVREFERRDLQDNAFTIIKAHCTQCLFRLTDD